MSHHCTRTTANKLMFFENGRRVREGEYRRRYPTHNDQECLTTQQRRQRIQAAIRSLSGVRTEQNQLLTECHTRLGRCNQRVAELEAQLLEKNKEFIERERDVRAEMKTDIEDLQDKLRKGKDCSEEIAELTQRMKEDLSVARREKDEISQLLNATTSVRDRLSGQLGEMTQREQNCNERMQKTQQENEQERQKREKAEADLINLRAEHQKCNENLEKVSRLLSDSKKYQSQLEALRQEHSECKERTRQLETENASLSSLPEQLYVLNRETQVIREQMANLVQQHSAELSGKTQQLSELQKKYDNLYVYYNYLKQLYNSLRSSNSELQGEYDQINEELQNMKSDLKRAPVESAPALKASIQEVNNDRQELLGQIESLTTQIKEKDNRLIEQTNLREQEQAKTGRAQADLINLNSEYQKISEAKQTIERRIDALESDNASIRQKLKTCEEQKQIFVETIDKSSVGWENVNNENRNLRDQKRTYIVEQTNLREQDRQKRETTEAGLINLRAEHRKISEALEIINREKTEMTEKMTKLQDDYESSIIDNEQLNVLLNQSKFFSLQHIEKVEKSEKALVDATIRMNSEIERLNKSCEENVSNLQSQLQSSKTECDQRVKSLQQQLAETQDMLKSKSEQLEGKELTLIKIEADLKKLQSEFNENNERFNTQQQEWNKAKDMVIEYQGDMSQKDEKIARLNAERQQLENMMAEKEDALNKKLSELQSQYEKALMVSAPSSGASTPMVTPEEKDAEEINVVELSEKLKKLSKSSQPIDPEMAKRAERIRQNMENKNKKTGRQPKSDRPSVLNVSEENKEEDQSQRDLEWKAEQGVKWDRYRELSKKLPISKFNQAKQSLSDFLGGDSNKWSGDKHDRIDRILDSDKTALKQKLDSGKINQSVYQTELQKITKKQTDEVRKYSNLKTAYDIARSELNQAIGELRELSSILKIPKAEQINETEKLEEERFLFGKRKKNGKKSKRTKRKQKRRSTNRNNRKNRK